MLSSSITWSLYSFNFSSLYFYFIAWMCCTPTEWGERDPDKEKESKLTIQYAAASKKKKKKLNGHIFLKYVFVHFWLCWVFVALHGLSQVVESRGSATLPCMGLSLWWLLLLQTTGSRCTGSSCCGTEIRWSSLLGPRACRLLKLQLPGLEVVACKLSCFTVCPLHPQGSPEWPHLMLKRDSIKIAAKYHFYFIKRIEK